ncbi:hypothetical protein ACP4OV_002137 [Aristida adscensionis]
MSAVPEEFLADPEPFSPSVFLDLPATPRPHHPHGGGGGDLALDDDLVLPFISRMLMEDDIDDKFFYQYPDHPVLLRAQQPYAQILSDAATNALSLDGGGGGAAAVIFAGSDSTNTNGSGAYTLSPSMDDATAFANATWPYDPVELSQLLLSTPYPDMGVGLDGIAVAAGDASGVSAFLNGHSAAIHSSGLFLDGAEEIDAMGTTLPPSVEGDGEHGALVSAFFSGPNRVTMDMLNLAFLKGMEEAKKFLPTDSSIRVDLEATSAEYLPIDNDLSDVFAAGQVKNNGVVDAMAMFHESGNGRGRKNRRNWDALEADTDQNSKMMVPEPEESGEIVDTMIIGGYEMCLEKMKDLRITMGSKAEKNSRSGKVVQGRQSSNEAVDLRTLLIHCAQAVSMDDRRSATGLLRHIKQHSSPLGDANQRLAHCFAEALEVRLAGTGSQVYKSVMTKRASLVEFLKAHQLYLAACCFQMTAFRFSNMTICKAIAGKKKVHIVDYGAQYGFQWPSLLEFLGTWKDATPEITFTGIDLPQPGFRPAARIEETGRRLSSCAHQFGVPFKFHSITAKWKTVRVDDLNIDPDEVLIVNSIIHFEKLMDEGVDISSPSPRDVVLSNIREMRPNVFILCVVNGSYRAPFFATRFREALSHYSAIFDMLDATAPRDNDQRLLVEDIIGRSALNVIACEGSDRVERPEAYKQWQARNHRAGLRQLPLHPDIVHHLREKVKNQYHKDFIIDMDNKWLLQGWKGRILYAMSTWVADDAVSEL